MKIAYVVHMFPTLYNSFTLNEITQVLDAGDDVAIFSLAKSNFKVVNEHAIRLQPRVRYFVEFLPGYCAALDKAHRVFSQGKRVGRKLHLAPIADELYSIAGKALFGWRSQAALSSKYRSYLGWNHYALENLARHIRRGKFDVIHAGFGNRPATAAMLLSRLSGVPYSFEAHAYDLFVDFPFADEKTDSAARIVTISDYNRSYFKNELGCDPGKVVVMRVPINTEYCDKVVAVKRSDSTIVSVARLHPIKGFHCAIEAFAEVADRRKDLKFMILGDGPLRKSLQAQIDRLGLRGRVQLLGSAGNEKALELMATGTLFLLPSEVTANGDRDGIPTSIIEAMYMKIPVVSTRVSGIPELISDGVDGFLTEPGDVRQIAQRLETLLDDRRLRMRMGEAARRKVIDDFYKEDCVSVLRRAWRDAAGAQPQLPASGAFDVRVGRT